MHEKHQRQAGTESALNSPSVMDESRKTTETKADPTAARSLASEYAKKIGTCLVPVIALYGADARAHLPETNPNNIETRVYVTDGPRADLVRAPLGTVPVGLKPEESVSVVWMSKGLKCDGGKLENPEKYLVPPSTELSCTTETGDNIMNGVTSVTARVPAPLTAGSYSFDVSGCDTCRRDIAVTPLAPVLTEESGYTRPQVDENISKIDGGENCCDLSAGLIIKPDMGDSTATEGYGANMEFQARPHENFGIGMQYSYSVADVWLNPELQRGLWTDNTHPEHLHQLHAKGVFTAPVITGDHDWLRLEVGGLLGGSIWHYENMPYDQYQGDVGADNYSWQVKSSQNQTRMTFDVGATAGARFYPHKNVMLQVGVDAITNVNGHDRIRSENTQTYAEPENSDHDLRLDVKANLGVSF